MSEHQVSFRSQFLSERYWPQLDGLRAVSIILVLAAHTADPLWSPLNGSLGVTLFFVISGFLITTLLLREEAAYETVSLSRFYIRRVFRIVPLYVLALALAAVLVLVFRLGQGGSDFLERLPLLLTFNGELAGSGTFSHSWSLGIEEKFYILWPAVAFGIPWVRKHRLSLLLVLTPFALIANFVPALGYVGIYLPILGGCLIGVLANGEKTFPIYAFLAKPAPTLMSSLLMVIALLSDSILPIAEVSDYSHVVFSLAALLALPGLLSSRTWLPRVLALRPIAYFGTRAYAIYLFHPFVLDAIDRLIAPGQSSVVLASIRLVMLVGISLLVAEILGRLVEAPLIRVGRQIASRVVRPEPKNRSTPEHVVE